MHFCVMCNNMYYVSLGKDDDLSYYCRNCGFVDPDITVNNITVSKSRLQHKEGKNFYNFVNKYTKYDPTLPRIYNIPCPNSECTEKNREIVYLRYDTTNMKYLYLCCKCDTKWTN